MDTDPKDKDFLEVRVSPTRRTLHATEPAAGLRRKPLKTRGRRILARNSRPGSGR